jgi:serine phosphatase RsbU (regulator of sigma subunit)
VALECGEPRESLERLNHVALSLREPTPLTTCCFAVADLAAHQLSWALAGHPPAVVCALDGTTSLLGAPPGLPLGVAEDAVYRTCTAPISPGDRLVFYTDGLIERLDEGIERLCRGLAQSRDLPPASAATWLAASVSPRLDDVALIVMDVGPQL